MYNQLSQEPDLSGLPPEERRVVHRALLKEPGDRWPDCRTFVAYLERSLGGDVGVAMASWFGNATTEQAREPNTTSADEGVEGGNGPPDYHTYLSNAGSSGQRSATTVEASNQESVVPEPSPSSPGWRPPNRVSRKDGRSPWPWVASVSALTLTVASLVIFFAKGVGHESPHEAEENGCRGRPSSRNITPRHGSLTHCQSKAPRSP